MPPRHVTSPVHACRAHPLGWLRFAGPALLALIVLTVVMPPRAHAQSMPPATTAPVDAFHQPCVAVRAAPDAVMPMTPSIRNASKAGGLDTVVGPTVRKLYVDLDDRCAAAPAFAPTRNVDPASVWYVDDPAVSAYVSSPHPGNANTFSLPDAAS